MISIFAALNGSILSGSRVPYAMARDGYFFSRVSRVNPQISHAGGSHHAAWLVVVAGAAERAISATLYTGDLSELDFVRNDRRLGHCFAAQTAGSRPALSCPGLSAGTISVRSGCMRTALFHFSHSPRESGIGLAVIVARTSVLFSLEEQNRQVRRSPLAGCREGLRKKRAKVPFCSVFRTNVLKSHEIVVKLEKQDREYSRSCSFFRTDRPVRKRPLMKRERQHGCAENAGGFTPGTRAD